MPQKTALRLVLKGEGPVCNPRLGVDGRISTSDICAILEGEKRVSGGRVDLDFVSGVFRLRAASSNYR